MVFKCGGVCANLRLISCPESSSVASPTSFDDVIALIQVTAAADAFSELGWNAFARAGVRTVGTVSIMASVSKTRGPRGGVPAMVIGQFWSVTRAYFETVPRELSF